MKFVAAAVALLLAACSANSVLPAGDPGTTGPPPSAATVAETAAPASATPSPMIESPSWPPQPTRDERFTRIATFTLGDDRMHIALGFTGARAYAVDDPCSAAYAATSDVVDGVLEIGVTASSPARPTEPWGCDDLGYDRHLDVSLDEPFNGTVWRDLAGYRHFLAPPDGLVELTGLPDGWALRNGRDVEDSPTGRWERTYSPDPSLADRTRTLDLYQSFDGPVNVSGGEGQGVPVVVSGQPATLYRSPSSGELVLVWRLGNDGLALVAYEQAFSVADVIALAESARAASPSPSASTAGPDGAVASSTDGRFRLVLVLPGTTFSTDEAITGRGILSVEDGAAATIGGPGAGPLAFSFDEVGGSRRMDAGYDTTCGVFTIEPGVPMTSDLTKSGGWADDDPNASFYRSFFADPAIHLPPGTWDISANAWFAEDACSGPDHHMTATARVIVTP